MYNVTKPTQADLPSSKKLLRSTLIAIVAAIVILITVVLPAEYAIDPTGIGRMLGLTEMGEIKAQLAEEAAADAERDRAAAAAATPAQVAATQALPAAAPPASPSPAAPATEATGAAWRDEMRVVLAPGEGAEVKLVMQASQKARFSWIVENGEVNFDLHGDGGGQAISYQKGRGVASNDGTLEAAFDGNHGWFWRNRGTAPVTVVVKVAGDYAQINRMI